MQIPEPRGPLSASLCDCLVGRRRAPGAPVAPGADPLADDDLQLTLFLCLRAALPRVRRRGRRWEWTPALLALPRRARGGVFEAALREAVGPPPARRPPVAEGVSAAPDRRGRRRRRPLSRYIERDGDAGAVPRVRRPPLRLPAEGGRPAHLGDPAAHRPAEGGAGRDPVRRVRRRPRRARCTPAVRRRRWGRSASTTPTAPTSTAAGRDAGHGQPDVAVRAAPPPGAARSSATSRVRDDVLAPEPPLRERPAAARLRRGGDRVLRRARRGRRGARAHRRVRSGRRPRGPGAGAGRRHPLRGPGAARSVESALRRGTSSTHGSAAKLADR